MKDKNIQVIIKNINETYNALSNLSDDELRTKFREIRNSIAEQHTSLDSVLVDVFAIVKETMRRFTIKEITVEASIKDRAIADHCDFMYLNKGKAIFRRQWYVLGEKFKWDMIPYDEQLEGGIEIHNGRILQMATGEGKTLVAIAPAILNAISGKGVHLMTVNEYLSQRDYEITRPIYSFLGISVGCIEGKSRRSIQRKEAYACDITFGTTSNFIFDYLYDHTAKDAAECVQNKFGFAIVDEADSVLIDEAMTSHILSGGILDNQDVDESPYTKYMPLVKLLTEQNKSGLYETDTLRKEVTLTSKGKKWLSKKCGDTTLFDNRLYANKIKQIEKDHSLTDAQKKGLILAEHNAQLSQLKLQNIFHQLLLALTVFDRDIDYIVADGKIIIVDPNTGRLKPSHVWEYGLHEAIMAKEHLYPKIETSSICGIITIKNYLLLYEKLSGMTGTAIAAIKELKEVYDLEVVEIPTHKPIIRIDHGIRKFATSRQALEALSQEVAKLHKEQRPILIGVNSIRQSEHISSFLQDKGFDPQLLNAKTLDQEAFIIAHAGTPNCITVATNVAGRGTDIKPTIEALRAGGLAIIGWGIADSKRIDQQLIGRSGRQGNPGSSQFFVSCEDKIIGYLSKNDKCRLGILTKTANQSNGELMDDRSSKIFRLAQQNKEDEDRKNRVATIKRDDIINPFRKLLYDIRMRLLNNMSDATISCYKLFNFLDNPNFKLKYKNHQKGIEYKVLQTIRKVLPNIENIDVYSSVPFVANEKIFTIKCDFRKAIESQGVSISNELEQQILLMSIDKLWFNFINEINNNFIPESEIESIYQKILAKVNDELRRILLTITLPINEAEHNNNDAHIYNKNKLLLDENCELVGDEELCPCGSCKPYWQCHGRLLLT